jgi:hypothetical protein
VKRIVASAVVCGVAAATLVAGVSAARPTSAGNKRTAERDTARLLLRLVLPEGAVQLAREPRGDGGLLKQSDSIPSGLLVDRHRLWLVHEPLDKVAAFVDHHPPSGGKKSGTGSSGGPGIPPNASTTFSFPALAGRISTRELEVDLVALPHHRTGVRVDAQDIWMVPRPASEKVPAAVREVDVRTRKTHVQVTSAAKVRRIVRLFDALPIVQPGFFGCPPDTIRRPPMSLRFLSARGALLARASVPGSFATGSCAPIEFWIGRHRQKPLSGHLYGQIGRLLGVRFG